jgi:parallel beta-helix repeat protein
MRKPLSAFLSVTLLLICAGPPPRASAQTAGARAAVYARGAAGDASPGGGSPSAAALLQTGEYISVKDAPYNAAGNGTANDTAALQAAVNAAVAAGGGAVFLPPGTYRTTGLTLQGSNVTLFGIKGLSRIAMASPTGNTLQIGTEKVTMVHDCKIEGVVFEPLVRRASGSEVFAPAFINLTLRDVKVKGVYRGFYLGAPAGCVDVHMTGVWAEDFYQFAYMVRVIQGYFYAVEADGQRADTVNLHIDGYCEGLTFAGCIFISNFAGAKRNSIMLETGTAVVSRPSQFVQFYGCYFDFGNYAVVAQNAYSYSFTDCWFKGGTADGVLLLQTAHEFTFKGCQFFNSGANGLYINGSSGHVVTGNQFINNGTVVGGSNGIRVAAPGGGVFSQGIVITSNRIGTSPPPRVSDAGLGSQSYGVQIDAGTLSFIVKDNDCRGNTSGAVNNLAGTSANKIVADNLF